MKKMTATIMGIFLMLLTGMIISSGFWREAVAENKPETDDDFIKPKAHLTEPDDPFSRMQKQLDSFMNKPFFNDPSINNLRGFDMFDKGINEHFNRMFESLNSFPGMSSPSFNRKSAFGFTENGRTDIREIDGNLVIKIDLPGHSKDSIDLKLKDNRLIVSSERRESKDERDDKSKVFRSEVSYGSFSRVIELPRPVIEEGIDAKFEDGVLVVMAPVDNRKPPRDEGRKITIR